MALAVAYQTVASVSTSYSTAYTTQAANASSFSYARDLVVTNSGANTIFVGLGTSSVATSVASFSIPPGGSIVLTECQVPQGVPLTVLTGTGASQVSIGYASVVSVI